MQLPVIIKLVHGKTPPTKFDLMIDKLMKKSDLNFKIRDAQKSDMNSVHEIFNEVLSNTTATFEEVPYSLQAWIEILHSKKSSTSLLS